MTDTPTTPLSARVLAYVRQHPGCTTREATRAIGDSRTGAAMAAMRQFGTLAATGARGSCRYSVAREPKAYRIGVTVVRDGAGAPGAVEALLANHDALQERRDALRAAIELLGGGAA